MATQTCLRVLAPTLVGTHRCCPAWLLVFRTLGRLLCSLPVRLQAGISGMSSQNLVAVARGITVGCRGHPSSRDLRCHDHSPSPAVWRRHGAVPSLHLPRLPVLLLLLLVQSGLLRVDDDVLDFARFLLLGLAFSMVAGLSSCVSSSFLFLASRVFSFSLVRASMTSWAAIILLVLQASRSFFARRSIESTFRVDRLGVWGLGLGSIVRAYG